MVSSHSANDQWTIQQILQWSQGYLDQLKVSETPRLDCELLLSHALGLDRMQLYLRLQNVVPEAPRTSYREALRRRGQGEPIAYLLGYKDFWKHRFAVTKQVLIPRPDTETLVELALGFMSMTKSKPDPWTLLDIGTGSGCIALSLLLDSKCQVHITGLDIEPGALQVAAANAEQLTEKSPLGKELLSRIRWKLGDIKQVLTEQHKTSSQNSQDSPAIEMGQYHFIVSNPPYIARHEADQLSRSVIGFEPSSALFAGENGLEFYRYLAHGAHHLLYRGGVLLVEIGAYQSEDVRRIFADNGWLFLCRRRDLGKKDRALAFTYGSWEDLGQYFVMDDLETLVQEKPIRSGDRLEYMPFIQVPLQEQHKAVSGHFSSDHEVSAKIPSSPSALRPKVEVYYEEALLSQEEEILMAQYGKEDAHEDGPERKSH